MSLTEADREIFRQRFKEPIELLITREHTGFALMMIALPLLERLLRGRSHSKDVRGLSELFHRELLDVFPALEDVKGAKAFWQSFRHGILHQATFSLKRPGHKEQDFSGIIGFEQLSGPAVALRRSDNPEHIVCMVDPVAFAREVLAEVESDLETFANAEPDRHPIAFVENLSGGVYSFLIPLKGIDVDQESTSSDL